MSGDSRKNPSFVDTVRAHTQKFVDELTQENGALRQRIELLTCDKQLLEERLGNLEEELRRERGERRKLLETLESIEALRASTAEEYAAVEQENSNLASLYSATYSLHGTLDRSALLEVIKEIVINLIGSEQIAIFELCRETPALKLIASVGIDAARYRRLPLDSGIIGHTVRTQQLFPRKPAEGVERAPHESDLSACVPLVVAGETIGAIAVFELLQQKAGLSDLDYELFDMLASQASFALHCAELHARYRAQTGG